MESINSVLKPCQFCGGRAVLIVENGVHVMCLSCGVGTSIRTDTVYKKGTSQERIATSSIDELIEVWNRRV
jgi:hypothetical protein